ncbi:MAG TPA: hypothetical protein H9773_01165 [Candidatus Fournierella merdavium]|nr:hypothetical protein [Candidatus Fournierella merdavium]
MKNQKTRIFLGVVVIVGVFALIFGYNLYKQIKQEDAILQELGENLSDYAYFTNCEFDRKNDNGNVHSVTVYVSEDFNDLHYSEIEDFMRHAESEFSMAYLDVMIDSLTREQMDNYDVLARVVCGDTVYTHIR